MKKHRIVLFVAGLGIGIIVSIVLFMMAKLSMDTLGGAFDRNFTVIIVLFGAFCAFITLPSKNLGHESIKAGMIFGASLSTFLFDATLGIAVFLAGGIGTILGTVFRWLFLDPISR